MCRSASVLYFSVVVVRFKAVGNAPIMKQNFFRVTVSNHFQAVIQFLRRELGWKAGDPLVSESEHIDPLSPTPVCAPRMLFCAHLLIDITLLKFTYINLAFSPAPDDTIANLYRVSPSPTRHPTAETNQTEKKVIRDGWASHSKL